MKQHSKQLLRILMFCFLTFISTSNVHAKCRGPNVTLWPDEPNATYPRNPVLFIGIRQFTKKDAMVFVRQLKKGFLRSRKHKVRYRVRVLKSSKVSAYFFWVEIKPKQLLRSNRTYRFHLPRNLGNQRFQTFRKYTIQTDSKIDRQAPKKLAKPNGSKYKFTIYGCGTGQGVTFTKLYSKDNHTANKLLRYIFKVTHQSKKGNKTFLVNAAGWMANRVLFGHGMCGGSFSRFRKGLYKIQIAAIDMAGNQGHWSSTFSFQFRGRKANYNTPKPK